MPKFNLNTPRKGHAYYALSTFAKGYVEAMFFTNGDIGDDERENRLNEMGVERLTRAAIDKIVIDCERFYTGNLDNIRAALALEPGSEGYRYANIELDDDRLGNLFWYARQGHGVAFTDDGDAACLEALQKAAQAFGECYVEVYRGWIYCR